MKFDNNFKVVKIRHVVIMYLITMAILIAAAIFILLNSDGEINNSDLNNLSLLAGIVLFVMLNYKIKPSKKKINILYKDFKNKLNIKEIMKIIILLKGLNIGGTRLLIDIMYLVSPNFANEFINDVPLIINSMTDYWVCFMILVIISPIVDELTFRYVLFKRLSNKFNIYVGLIVSTAVFSTVNICPQIIEILALGIINCIIYAKYENILMPMFIYFINSLVYMGIFIPLNGFKTKFITLTSYDVKINAVLGTILFIIGIILLIKFIIENKIFLKESFNKSRNIRV